MRRWWSTAILTKQLKLLFSFEYSGRPFLEKDCRFFLDCLPAGLRFDVCHPLFGSDEIAAHFAALG